MIIATVDIPYQHPTRKGGVSLQYWALLKCDMCRKSFLKKKCVKVALNKTHHFCSHLCARQSDISKSIAKQTSIQHYGVDHPMKSSTFILYMRECWTEIYGVDHPRKAESVINLIKINVKKTNQKRHNVDYPMQSPVIRQKKIDNHRQKHGVDYHQQRTDCVKSLKNYGDVVRLTHWKTNETLVCRASYEVAFVTWCNLHKIDFDWQIRFKTPFKTEKGNDSYYFVDAHIKTGLFANIFIEIKGLWRGTISRMKWDWFHELHHNSELWDQKRLEGLKILKRKI